MIYVSSLEESEGQTYNLGSGKETQIIDIANEINKQTGNKAGIQYLPRRSWDNILKRNSDFFPVTEIFSRNTDIFFFIPGQFTQCLHRIDNDVHKNLLQLNTIGANFGNIFF